MQRRPSAWLRPHCIPRVWLHYGGEGSAPARLDLGGVQGGSEWTRRTPAPSTAHLGSGVMRQVIQPLLPLHTQNIPRAEAQGAGSRAEACLEAGAQEDAHEQLQRWRHPPREQGSQPGPELTSLTRYHPPREPPSSRAHRRASPRPSASHTDLCRKTRVCEHAGTELEKCSTPDTRV